MSTATERVQEKLDALKQKEILKEYKKIDMRRHPEKYEMDKVEQNEIQTYAVVAGKGFTLNASIPYKLLMDNKISGNAKTLFGIYYIYMNKKDIETLTYVGRERIATHFKGQKSKKRGNETASVRSISRWTLELEEHGWIKVKRGFREIKIGDETVKIGSNLVELQGTKIRKNKK